MAGQGGVARSLHGELEVSAYVVQLIAVEQNDQQTAAVSVWHELLLVLETTERCDLVGQQQFLVFAHQAAVLERQSAVGQRTIQRVLHAQMDAVRLGRVEERTLRADRQCRFVQYHDVLVVRRAVRLVQAGERGQPKTADLWQFAAVLARLDAVVSVQDWGE